MQRYFAKGKSDNYIVLEDGDMHHVKNVMRMVSDDRIECVFNKKVYLCKVGDVLDNKFEIIEEKREYNELPCEVAVAIGLVREQKMDLILQKLTELGVNTIIPVSMERSIVKLDDSKFAKKKTRWETICKEASEQSKRTSIPVITEIMSVKELAKLEAD